MSDSEASTTPALPRNEYTIGWVCALSTELTAATAMLDQEHESLGTLPGDNNAYTLGSIGEHNIAIACLPMGKTGTTPAAVVATQMLKSFPSIKFGLFVGVGGGIPSDDHDIRLGDVVVSTPIKMFPGVVQLDLGKAIEGGFERIGSLDKPPDNLLTALTKLKSQHELKGSKIQRYIGKMVKKRTNLKRKYNRQDSMEDVLFASDDITKIVQRKSEREPRDSVEVHYGLIASGNRVVADATVREKINSDFGGNVLCVEMEAAGLMDNFPCLVIRGICDYADSYKNDDWQGYAAATAAAFAKELLSKIPASEVERMENINVIAGKIGEISEVVKKIDQHRERHARDDILEWLTPVNYDAQHHEHLSKRSPESGNWIFEHPNFQRFLEGNEKTLLCQGNPGAGKTILTSAVIEHLQRHGPSYEDVSGEGKVSLAFIYFDFIRKESQRTIDVLASLVKQLVRDEPSLPTTIEDLQKKYKTIPASSRSDKDIKEFSKALKDLISDNSRKTLIVIDALDECHDSNDFLANLFTVLKDTEAKLFATTRPIEGVEKRFKSGLFLEISASTEDVEDYVGDRLPEFTVLSDDNYDIREELRISLRREIVTKISTAIDGIFLLAKFHVDSLLMKTTLAQIRKTLQDLPRGPEAYKQAYEKTIFRICGQPSEHQQLARRALQWLACAAREITALELRHALAIRGDGSSLPSEEVLESTNFIIKVCMGLVIVERESGVIRLLHHTALEYLQQNMNCLWSLEDSETTDTRLLPPKSPKCAMQEVHQDIATVCIKYLSLENIQRFQDYDQNIPDEYPFLEYTTHHWARHWREGFNEMSLPVSMIEITTTFLGNRRMDILMDVLETHELQVAYRAREMTILHLTAYFGLTSMIDVCLNNGHDIHATTGRGANALWFALLRKHEDTYKALLKRGAKEAFVDFRRGILSSLGLAIHNRMGVAADLLRDDSFGAVINPEAKVCTHPLDPSCSCSFRFPLLVAAEVGNLEMTKMLLKRGAEPLDGNDSSGNGSVDAEALTMAATKGHDDVLECLLQADDSAVNAVDEGFTTPLYWTIRKSRWSTANILLRFGGKLFGSGTASDPGLPSNVSLVNGQPSSIRFWGRDGMPVDITYDSYDAFRHSWFLRAFLDFYSKSPSTVFVPCASARVLEKGFAWNRHVSAKLRNEPPVISKVYIDMEPFLDYEEDETDLKFAREVRREHLWEDMEQFASYLTMFPLEIAMGYAKDRTKDAS